MSNPWRVRGPFNSSKHTNQILLASLLTVTALVVANHAFSETRQSEATPVEFNIPAQSVPAALSEFARQARVQLFFISDGFENIQANAVVGTYATQHALDLLLTGTGLAASILSESGVKVRPVRASAKSLPLDSQLFAAAADETTGGRDAVDQDDSEPQRIEQRRDGEMQESVRQLEEILVTGSRIRGAQSASPLVTITRHEIDRAGFATVEQIVDKLPQNFGAGASQDAVTNATLNRRAVGGDVGNFAGGTSVNLRGLGASSTLVLFNGRRMSPSGRSASFTDISAIPVSAIERVELLTDGASAIYGSDAIGGVVNFIMRNDYDGAETRLRYGSDSGGDTSETVLAQSLGKSWDGGNVLFSYEYYHHDNLANIDRDFAASNDLTRFGGDDFRSDGGNPANIVAAGQTYAIPAGQDGTSLTAADFPVDANGIPTAPLNRFSAIEATDMLPAQKRHSAFLSLSQNLGLAELFADVRFSTRDSKYASSPAAVDIDVPETNPHFVDPSGAGLTTVTVENYLLVNDLGAQINKGTNDSYGVVLGAKFDIGEAWNAELAGNWSKEEASLSSHNRLDSEALADAVNQTDPALAFNPFGDGSHTNPAVLDTLRTGQEFIRSENELRAIGVNVNGSVLDAPGGAIQIATGVDFRKESLQTLDVPVSGGSGLVATIDDSRDVAAVYAEFFFPLVTADNSRPGLQRLELSLAGRYEDYSDFGSSSNPKVGLVWFPTQSLILRGTWGTSFRAPQLTDLNTASGTNRWGYLPQFFVDCCGVPFPVLVMQGANGDLKAEEATTWTLGFQWSSESIKGLSLDMTYFAVDFDNRIDTPFLSLLDGFDPRFASLLNTMPIQEQIAAIVNDPNYINPAFGIPTPSEDILSGAAPVGGIMDRRINNLSRSVVTGVETQIAYTFDTSVGTFDLGLNGNYLFDFERALLAVDPLVDEIGTIGRPVDFRARGTVTWNNQGWSVSGFVNYIDGYTDNVNDDPPRSIDSWTTVDLTIAYDTGDNKGIFDDTRLSLTAQNLFDDDPPFVNNFGLSYDPTNANGLGRFVAIQVAKEW
jgi:outer membrane receptor protein involved in Fe transport